MEKVKKLTISNNIALCFIAIISIVISIGASYLFYYFDRYVDVSKMSLYYQVLKGVINVIFILSIIALMVHVQYKIFGKTLLERIDLKKNKKIKLSSYWFISVILGLIAMYVFDTAIPNFDKYFLFILLAIFEICDIVADYMMSEFEVNNEDVSLSYLIFAVLISVCCYVVFNFSNLVIENNIIQRYSSEKQFCIITKNLLSKVETNNIVELKEYVNRINSLKEDNELIENCALYINSLEDVITDEQIEQLKATLGSTSSTTNEFILEENFKQEKEELRKSLAIEGLLIFFISLAMYVVSIQAKRISLKKKTIKKVIKKEVKVESKKEVKKEVKAEVKKEEKTTKKEVKAEAKKEEKTTKKTVEAKPKKGKKVEPKKEEIKKVTTKKASTKKSKSKK